MLKKSLAALALATSLTTSLAACGDRAPHIIQVPAAATAPEAPHVAQMTVNGQATLEVTPDCADLTITLTGDSTNPGTAAKSLENKKLTLIASLQKIGIEISDIKLSTLQLDPIFAETRTGVDILRVRTYRAAVTITATTRDFGKLGDMMDAAATAGATNMSAAFRRSDLPELKKKVRDMALTAAKAKAEQTAATLGIKLGDIVTVVENPAGYMWSATYFPQNAAAVQDSASPATIGGALQPLTLDVSVGYEFAKKS